MSETQVLSNKTSSRSDVLAVLAEAEDASGGGSR